MREYHKITTLFERDPETRHKTVIDGKYAKPEFEFLQGAMWTFTEKVDGQNIRVHWNGENICYCGRTDDAQAPMVLLNKMMDIFSVGLLRDVLGTPSNEDGVTLYGEGYGAKIGKGGEDYIPDDCGFILFDVQYGDLFLERKNVVDIADKLGVPTVPILAHGTLLYAAEMVRDGFSSLLRSTPPEGLVMRPEVELRDRRGKRIITKLKLKDYRHAETRNDVSTFGQS